MENAKYYDKVRSQGILLNNPFKMIVKYYYMVGF